MKRVKHIDPKAAAELAQAKLDAEVRAPAPEGQLGKLRGHLAVDPAGNLVTLLGDDDLPDDGWRWATKEDVAIAEKAKLANQERDERERAAKLAQARQRQDVPNPPKGGPLRKR